MEKRDGVQRFDSLGLNDAMDTVGAGPNRPGLDECLIGRVVDGSSRRFGND